MPLVSLNPILSDARKRRYGVPAFDVSNGELIRAAIEVCAEERAPAILMLLRPEAVGESLLYVTDVIKSVSKRNPQVPVCLHIDHAGALDEIKEGIAAGATSVMYDGSRLPFSENVRLTREAAQYAHARGISIEAELGHVGDGLVGRAFRSDAPSDGGHYTDPDDVANFVRETGVDCLAVAIGTQHGVYVGTPQLRFDILEAIAAVSPCPLVLHGGSGTPDDDVRQAISLGICKINVYTEVLAAFNSALKERLEAVENISSWPSVTFETARERIREVMRHKLRAFGASGKA